MLGRLFEQRALSSPWGQTSPDNLLGYWPGDPEYGAAGSGNALQLVTVLGCVRLISDQISTLPIDVFRKAAGAQVEAPKPMWLEEPEPGLDFASWCGQVLSSLLLYGNAYILVGRGESLGIVSLRVLDPSIVRVDHGKYYVNDRAGAEIVHIRGLMLPGAEVGLNPIGYARETIGLGLSALAYGKGFFDRGDGNMPGVIEIQKPAQEGTKEQLAKQWQRKRSKGGRGLPGVLDDGATWKPTAISNEDAQFLATRNYTAAEIAGQLFLIDPSDLGIPVAGTSLTYGNLQDRNTRRVQVTLLPWITRVEAAISSLLAAPRYMKFNVDGLLRGSLKDQMDTWAVGINSHVLVPNEPRGWMDLPPLEGGDVVVTKTTNPIGGANAA
jgi:HK97 family phage portal protein